jgi:hypothetical protein
MAESRSDEIMRTLDFWSQQLTFIQAFPSSIHPVDAVVNRSLDVRSAGFEYIVHHIRSPRSKNLNKSLVLGTRSWTQNAYFLLALFPDRSKKRRRAEIKMRDAVKQFNATLSEFVLKF